MFYHSSDLTQQDWGKITRTSKYMSHPLPTSLKPSALIIACLKCLVSYVHVCYACDGREESIKRQKKPCSDWSCILPNFFSIILKPAAFFSSRAKNLPPSFLDLILITSPMNSESLRMGAIYSGCTDSGKRLSSPLNSATTKGRASAELQLVLQWPCITWCVLGEAVREIPM